MLGLTPNSYQPMLVFEILRFQKLHDCLQCENAQQDACNCRDGRGKYNTGSAQVPNEHEHGWDKRNEESQEDDYANQLVYNVHRVCPPIFSIGQLLMGHQQFTNPTIIKA